MYRLVFASGVNDGNDSVNLKLNDMKKLLLLCVFCMGGVLSGRSQDVIVLHKDNPLAGRVLWEKSKGDSLFYRSAVLSGDSLLLFVPRRRVEYVLSDGDRRMLYRGKTRGWQPWRGRTFNEVPQHRMLYAASWSTILDGWSIDASAMRMINRNNRIGVGAFVRYLSTEPTIGAIVDTDPSIDTYEHQVIAFGAQAEVRGYSRRLKTFFYVDFGLGGAYHRFDWSHYSAMLEWLGESRTEKQYPSSRWAYQFNYRLGAYVRLTRGLYADVAFTGIGHIFTRIPQKYISSDQFPFGFSVGLRFGRERR